MKQRWTKLMKEIDQYYKDVDKKEMGKQKKIEQCFNKMKTDFLDYIEIVSKLRTDALIIYFNLISIEIQSDKVYLRRDSHLDTGFSVLTKDISYQNFMSQDYCKNIFNKCDIEEFILNWKQNQEEFENRFENSVLKQLNTENDLIEIDFP